MLRLAKLTDYAIVLLAHMARQGHVCVHSAVELADGTGVPLPTVQKVMKSLTQASLTLSVRGARGGYSLARDPAQIRLVEVIEAVEGRVALTACSAGDGEACSDEAHCQVSGHWPVINRAVRAALEQVSVLELSRPVHGGKRALPAARPQTSVEG